MSIDDEGEDKVPSSKSGIALALDCVKPIALILSGCWALYLFFGYERYDKLVSLQQKNLTLQLTDLSLQQNKLAYQTQIATQAATVQQQNISAAEAKLTLDTQKEQRDLRSADLQYEVDLARLTKESKQIDLNSKTTFRTSENGSLTARSLGNDLYEIALDPGMRNTSDIPFEVSLVLVDVYTGELNLDNVEYLKRGGVGGSFDRDVALEMEPPPGRWSSFTAQPGGIRWTRRWTVGSIYVPAIGHFRNKTVEEIVKTEMPKGTLDQYGAGTGIWKPGDRIPFDPRILVRVKSPQTYIGLSVHLCINRGEGSNSLLWSAHYDQVANLPTPPKEIK